MLDVHQQHVRLERHRGVDGLLAVDGFTHDLQVGLPRSAGASGHPGSWRGRLRGRGESHSRVWLRVSDSMLIEPSPPVPAQGARHRADFSAAARFLGPFPGRLGPACLSVRSAAMPLDGPARRPAVKGSSPGGRSGRVRARSAPRRRARRRRGEHHHRAAEAAAGQPRADDRRRRPVPASTSRSISGTETSKSSRIEACDASKARRARSRSPRAQRRDGVEHALVLGRRRGARGGRSGSGSRSMLGRRRGRRRAAGDTPSRRAAASHSRAARRCSRRRRASCGTPESIDDQVGGRGSGTRSKARLRASRKSAVPASARLAAIWSMMPTRRADELVLGALAEAREAHVVERQSRTRSRSARSRATSSAALDERPPPSGTSESMPGSKPRERDAAPRERAA